MVQRRRVLALSGLCCLVAAAVLACGSDEGTKASNTMYFAAAANDLCHAFRCP